MGDSSRMIYAVVAAEAHSIEQRQIIKGIAEQAQKYNIDIVVISNVYNPFTLTNDSPYLSCENMIYDLILSPDIDGIIVISESFLDEKLHSKVREYLFQRSVPIIIVGANNEPFLENGFNCINTDDSNDIEDITDHLIDVHGFDNIHFLTGQKEIGVSQLRVIGYKNSLEKHGIAFNENNVFYGDFWMTSGENLAEKYISGEIRMPQALICANDYMAYGLIDKLLENGISVPEQLSVIGYEYVRERHLHSPLLTTYERNRVDTGAAAVNILYSYMVKGVKLKFTPPKGRIIAGESCPCHTDKDQVYSELKSARIEKNYFEWNLYTQMEQQLTACRTLDEFISVAGPYEWNIRDVRNIFLCLSENWYVSDTSALSDNIVCRSIIPWLDNSPFTISRFNISEILSASDKAEIYYFTPLFFNIRPMGYLVLKYDKPDTYDPIFRNWLKSISNGLEFLRMKNDINSLIECQNLSLNRDSVTGILNEQGMKKELELACSGLSENDKILMMLVKTDIFSDGINIDKRNVNIHLDIEAAEVLKNCFGNDKQLCGKISDKYYVAAVSGKIDEKYAEIIADKLSTIITHSPEYQKNCGHDAIIIKYKLCENDEFDFDSVKNELINQINESMYDISYQHRQQNFESYYDIRNRIYKEPSVEWSIEQECRRMNHSTGYFRSSYKRLFGISFHQDVIQSRVAYAKYLILTTALSLSTIALKCGYEDDKYFFRQFKLQTGVTPNKYKTL